MVRRPADGPGALELGAVLALSAVECQLYSTLPAVSMGAKNGAHRGGRKDVNWWRD